MYSPHFKDNYYKIINNNPKDYYIELTVDKVSMIFTWRSIDPGHTLYTNSDPCIKGRLPILILALKEDYPGHTLYTNTDPCIKINQDVLLYLYSTYHQIPGNLLHISKLLLATKH